MPTEGGWGWAAVVGCILMHLCSGSLTRVFGILLVVLHERFPESSTATLTSVNGVGTALTMFIGPVITILMNKGISARWILVIPLLFVFEYVFCLSVCFCIQLNPAITDLKGPGYFPRYSRIPLLPI